MATIKTAIEIDVNTSASTQQSVKSFKQQLKELKIEAQNAVIQFGEFSPEALKAQQAVANLDDKMQDFNDRVKALNPDKFSKVLTVTSGITQGFQAAQGAMALFGNESEDLQKQLVKVQGAMALAQGLEGLGKVQQQFGALASTIGSNVVKAFSTLRGAIISTGIGALVVGLGLLIAYWDDIKEALSGVSKEQTKVNNAMRDAVASEQGQIAKIQAYAKLVNDNNLSLKERQTALKELNKLGVETGQIDLNNSKNLKTLNDDIATNIKLIELRAKAQALEKIIGEEKEKQFKTQNITYEEAFNVIERLDNAIGNVNKEQELSTFKQKQLAESQKLVNVASDEYSQVLKELNSLSTKKVDIEKDLNKVTVDNSAKIKAQKDYLDLQYKQLYDYLEKEKLLKQSARQQELAVLKKQYDEEIQNENSTYASRKVSAYKYKLAVDDVNKKYDKIEKDAADKKREDEVKAGFDNVKAQYEHNKWLREKEKADKIQATQDAYAMAENSFNALSALNDAFASKTEEGQKQAFEIDKALKYASTVLSTIEGTQNAFTTANKSPLTTIFPAYPFIQAAAAAAFGIAQLKKISDTQYQSKTTPSSSGMGASGYVAPPTLRASTISNADNLTQNRKVFVTEGDITKTIKRVSANQQVSVVE